MKKIHLAISTQDLAASIKDYSLRLDAEPDLVITDKYALWRTDTLNFSVRQDRTNSPGSLRHLGWEDSSVSAMSEETDVNGVVWERFTAEQQIEEIRQIWSEVDYSAGD